MVMLSSLLPVMTIDAAELHKMPFPVGKDISDRFVGTVHRNDLIEADDVYQVPQTNVITFEPGSYSGWHAHGAMTVIGVAGQGIYQNGERMPFASIPAMSSRFRPVSAIFTVPSKIRPFSKSSFTIRTGRLQRMPLLFIRDR